MRWFSAILAGSLFAAGSLAAKKSNGDRFEEFHAKALSSTPVKINDASYGKLTNAPRDYTAFVLLTALESRFGCGMCRDFQPEWDLLARSWTRGDKAGESRLVFGTLDFADGRDTFMAVGAKLLGTRAWLLENACTDGGSLQLGLQTAPVLLLFSPTTGPHAAASAEPIRFDFTGGYETPTRSMK